MTIFFIVNRLFLEFSCLRDFLQPKQIKIKKTIEWGMNERFLKTPLVDINKFLSSLCNELIKIKFESSAVRLFT